MKLFQISLILFLAIQGPVQIADGLTCSDAENNRSVGFSCNYDPNYFTADFFTQFPLGTQALTLLFDLQLYQTTGDGCGTSYPFSIITITVEDGSGIPQQVVELEHTSLSTISYKVKGVTYAAQTLSEGGPAFQLDESIQLKVSIDIPNDKVHMASTYGTQVYYNSPELTSAGFPSSWIFDSDTKFWLGENSGAPARLGLFISTLASWDGYLPYPSIYTGALLLGHFLSLIRDSKLREYQGYSLANNGGSFGTAYLGISTSGSADTVNSPDWMGERAILKFTGTKFITLPAFIVGQPNQVVVRSLSLGFWIKVTSVPSSSSYLFRYSDSALTTDRFSLKHDSSLNLQVCAGGVCQTLFAGLSLNTWVHLSVNWALRTKDASNYRGYYSAYKDGVLSKFDEIENVPISAATMSLANDKVRYGGGFTGQLSAIKIFSPGSLQVNTPTWCSSSSCGADLGASSPPACLLPASCHSSCNGCTDDTDLGCLACASGKYFYQGKCGACPAGTFINVDYCQGCSPHCTSCSSASSCSVCETLFLFYDDFCVPSCPSGSYQSGTNCLHCSTDCDVCIDANACTTCSARSYSYNQACYKICPTAAPYRSPNVDSTLCYPTCPTQTPYIYNQICYASCPPEAPSFSGYTCFAEDPAQTETEPAKLNNAAESTANTILITRSIASPSAPTPLMFGSISKLLQYTRYMNVSRSEDLESVFQAEDDSGDYIPMPTMSDRMQGAFESSHVPYVFEKYGLSSNFLLNQGDNLLGVLTVCGLFVISLLMQKGAFYIRNIPRARSVIVKSRFFFQNYFIGQFYEMLGDIAFSVVLELRTVALTDSYSLLSFISCIVCVIFGIVLFGINIWIVKKYQKKKNSYSDKDSQTKGLEEFSEKYKGIELLFGDFEDASFTHQALLIFFVGRNITFCLVIALFYNYPICQCFLLLVINIAIIGYYLWKRSIKSLMDYVEQLVYEVILFAVTVCFFILALAEESENAPGIVNTVSQIIIVLNIACKFIALGFLALRYGLTGWEYIQVLKEILQTLVKKKKATVAPESGQIMVTTMESGIPRNSNETSQARNTESNMMNEQSSMLTKINTRRRYLVKRPKIMPENSFALDQSSRIFQPDASSDRIEELTKEVNGTCENAPLEEIIERGRVIHGKRKEN